MNRNAPPTDLVRRLSAGRWFIPVLARMARDNGSRFSVLVRELAMSKSVLSATLDRLEKEGWVVRSPGHGHPLRPEYYLTVDGRVAAAWSETTLAQQELLGLGSDGFRRWSLPLIEEIGEEQKRFTALQAGLTTISPRALALELANLCETALVSRNLPGPLYGLTGRGLRFASATGLV